MSNKADTKEEVKEVKEDLKEVEVPPPVPAPPPTAVELILRPLHEGHTVSLAAKVAQPDGSVLDTVVESSSPQHELRLELHHLQEAVVRAKVNTVMVHDSAQSANTSKPYDEVFPSAPIPEEKGPEEKAPAHHTRRHSY